jgi:transposase
MRTATTRKTEYSAKPPLTLYLAFELGWNTWTLGFSVGIGQPPRIRRIDARDLGALEEEISLAKKRFGLQEESPVRSCYEAGRDGFWLHRFLLSRGIDNQIVDSSSIEVNRRAKRAKTDRMDANKLLTMLIRYHEGETRVWHILHVPSPTEEDDRQPHRELAALKKDHTEYTNRIKGLLASQGVKMSVRSKFPNRLGDVRMWDGNPLPTKLQERLLREYQRTRALEQQIDELNAEREKAIREGQGEALDQVRQLLSLRGIGPNSAWLFVMELFAWRKFQNRRELGAIAGLTPMPYQSGGRFQEQGIGKSGNPDVRSMAIEIAWGWLRYQPKSQLSRWYADRFGRGSARLRRIGIVALARKLLIALWRYLETGVMPTGAILKQNPV